MKDNHRRIGTASAWQRARARVRAAAVPPIAIVVVVATAACGNSSGSSASGTSPSEASTTDGTSLYGSLPPAGTPVSGGTVTLSQLTGQTPTYIFPIIPGANVTAETVSMVSSLFMPLYAGPNGTRPEVNQSLSAAEPPVFSNSDKRVTITIKPGLKWANGAPIDGDDVAFEYDLLKAAVAESPANWGQFAPNVFPLNVVSVTVSRQSATFDLDKAVNPGWFLNNNLQTTDNVFPLPSTDWNIASSGGPHLNFTNPANAKAIYNYLAKQGASVSTFATDPLWQDVSGPFKLQSFSATNGSYVLVRNPNYGLSPKPQAAEYDFNTFTSQTAALNALKSGSLDIDLGLDPSELPQVAVLKSEGISVYGGPSWGWYGGIINFKDTTNDFNHVIAQLYVRQAIAHLINQPLIISGAYKGAAVPAYGPIPSAPDSPYTTASATTPPFPYDPAAAVALLKAHGWKVIPNGSTTCQKAGTASDECGASIPVGTPISFVWANLPEATSTTGALESEALSSEAKAATGINIQLVSKTFNFLTSSYNDQNPAAAKYTNDWGVNNYGGISQDFYPTQEGLLSPVNSGLNLGYYNDPTANTLAQQSVTSSNPDAVESEAAYWSTHLALFYMPDQDWLIAASNKVGGNPLGFLAATQQTYFPQYFYAVR